MDSMIAGVDNVETRWRTADSTLEVMHQRRGGLRKWRLLITNSVPHTVRNLYVQHNIHHTDFSTRDELWNAVNTLRTTHGLSGCSNSWRLIQRARCHQTLPLALGGRHGSWYWYRYSTGPYTAQSAQDISWLKRHQLGKKTPFATVQAACAALDYADATESMMST